MKSEQSWSGLSRLPSLILLAGLAEERGQPVWLCGGSLRDLLMGREPPDLDLACGGDALALGRELAARAGGRFVPLGGEFATCRVVLGGGDYLDLAGLRAPDLEGDLRARDFTVNALALPLADLMAGPYPPTKIIDPTGGLEDLGNGLLRLAGPGVLADDSLRVLRAFRFRSSHGLEFAEGLAQDLAAAGPGLDGVAAERIGQEWLKLMAGARASQAVNAMDRARVLTRLVPELAAGRGMEQNPYHHLDVLDHSLACLQAAQELAGGGDWLGALGREGAQYLAGDHRRALFMTTALLHDLGKPPTRQPKEPGWSTFHRHETLGGKMARIRVRALGLSGADADYVGRLVAEHMRPFHLLGAERRGQLSKRAVRRLLMAAGEDLPAMFMLAMADTIAGKGPQRPPEAEQRLLALYEQVARLRDQELAQALAAPPLINGRELMSALGIGQGAEVGRLLGLIREAQLDGEIVSQAEAIVLARREAGAGTG